MCKLLLSGLLLLSITAYSQPGIYSVANAHSHNDYEKPMPFTEAYSMGFGSIEADIFLTEDGLVVAHDSNQLKLKHMLNTLYLQPLTERIQQNHGYPYADTARELQLMIDVKTAAEPTLHALVALLQQFPAIIHCKKVLVAISGNRPDPITFASYPSWIWFDGELRRNYPESALQRIVMLSDNFVVYSFWNGQGAMPVNDRQKLDSMVARAHQLNKKVRFWGAPDSRDAWNQFMSLQVDYINTDKIVELAAFLRQSPVSGKPHSTTASLQ